MISPLVLEQPGHWRPYAVVSLLALPLLPIMPLLSQGGTIGARLVVGSAFWHATFNSLALALLIGAIAWLVGLPIGVLAGLYCFPAKRLLLVLLALPLLVPSFLWAIGWMGLASRVGQWARTGIEGWTGCILVFSAGAISLTTFASLAATKFMTASATEAARLAGGDLLLLRLAVRWSAVPAAVAATLTGVLTLADPGPGQILGVHTVASEILTSFASSYDYALAARQCLWLTILILAVIIPIAVVSAPRLADQVLVRQIKPLDPSSVAHSWCITTVVLALILVVLFMPVAGLLMPLSHWGDLRRAGDEIVRTGTDTLIYAAGTAILGCVVGVLLAISVGRQHRLRSLVLAANLVIFSLPPSAVALGLLFVGTRSPITADWLLRSRLTVILALALRILPVAAVLSLRAFAAVPSSFAAASAISGVSLQRHIRRVLLPFMRPSLVAAGTLISLLAMADVGTVLLLHPPGRDTLPLAIFTIMGNAPESLVAALCFLYVVSAGALLWLLASREGGRL